MSNTVRASLFWGCAFDVKKVEKLANNDMDAFESELQTKGFGLTYSGAGEVYEVGIGPLSSIRSVWDCGAIELPVYNEAWGEDLAVLLEGYGLSPEGASWHLMALYC